VNRLRTWFRNEPAVQRAYYVTGTADHVVIVIARDIQEFDALVSEMMAHHKPCHARDKARTHGPD